ncbi:hypothetical protein V1264_010672 [Littorina saxatilis]|uniref:Fibrinogen C-terminal domain-containing protein n=1 Tax=Littorina saxatilis TaxID=31220 RepID=A0AAN9APV3_9CAEN
MFVSSTRSTLHCATLCEQQECCDIFTIDGDVCRGHSMLGMFNMSSFPNASGARSFVRNWTGNKPRNCVQAQRYSNESGVVTIYPDDDNSGLKVYCDQDTDKGGWLVFQRRQDGSVDFYRDWNEYQQGFGCLQGELWLGLDALHMLTSSQSYELRVDLMKFDGTKGYATYSDFTISDSSDDHRLGYGSFQNGSAGDSLRWHKGDRFSTWDADNDRDSSNCATSRHGAWWYVNCGKTNLNGRYKDIRVTGYDGIMWNDFDAFNSLKFSEMKMRPT